MSIDFLSGPIRQTLHRGEDDLLTAGLGLAGLRAAPPPFADAAAPAAAELRRRAIMANWKAIADLGPLGGYGVLYGSAAAVPGREYQAFAKLPGARAPHRVLVQIPDAFDAQTRCLVVTASSGSRGIYGAIALAGAWGLPRGCAVAYTDKGAGTGYFDTAAGTGSALDGTPARAGDAELEFLPDAAPADAGIAVKHAHSQDNPEADWGRHVLQAARFGLAMLERALPHAAPFTAANTRIIAAGLSNGAGAVLRAAGEDDEGLIDGVVALAPNIHAPQCGSRALYDHATQAALLLPCALAGARFDAAPFARVHGRVPPAWIARGEAMREAGLLRGTTLRAQSADALELLLAGGWNDAAIAAAAGSTALDLWRAIAATYASSYTRSAVGAMPGGFSFHVHDAAGRPRAATAAERAAWWSDAAGIAPGDGVFADEPGSGEAGDPALRALLALRALWTGADPGAHALRKAVAATAARLPRRDLPVWVIHGRNDGLLPVAFHSGPYLDWLRANDRNPICWLIDNVQHFDAFLSLPDFGDRYAPLLPYGYVALDRMFAHVTGAARLGNPAVPCAQPRGGGVLDAGKLGLNCAGQR